MDIASLLARQSPTTAHAQQGDSSIGLSISNFLWDDKSGLFGKAASAGMPAPDVGGSPAPGVPPATASLITLGPAATSNTTTPSSTLRGEAHPDPFKSSDILLTTDWPSATGVGDFDTGSYSGTSTPAIGSYAEWRAGASSRNGGGPTPAGRGEIHGERAAHQDGSYDVDLSSLLDDEGATKSAPASTSGPKKPPTTVGGFFGALSGHKDALWNNTKHLAAKITNKDGGGFLSGGSAELAPAQRPPASPFLPTAFAPWQVSKIHLLPCSTTKTDRMRLLAPVLMKMRDAKEPVQVGHVLKTSRGHFCLLSLTLVQVTCHQHHYHVTTMSLTSYVTNMSQTPSPSLQTRPTMARWFSSVSA